MNRRDFARSLAAGGAALAAGEFAWPRAAAQHAPKRDPNAIQIDSNENPYGPSGQARAAIAACVATACRYPDVAQQAVLEAIAAHHQVTVDQILLGCGGTEILRTADLTFLAPGKSVVASDPTFEAVLKYTNLMQANAVRVPQTADHRHDLKAMAAAVKPSTGLVYICNPNNPTGTIVSLTELEAFLNQVPATVPVLVDEAYFHFVDAPGYGSVIGWIGRHPNLIVLRTFSKVYGMAGMRLGYAVGSTAMMARMRNYELLYDGNVAVLEAALASLGDDAHVADQRRRNADTRAWLCAQLDHDHRAYIPAHANFVMIDTRKDVAPTIAAFAQRHILVGRKFDAMPTWLRVSMGTPAEMQSFVAALRAVVPA